ncbi:MAG TPA: methyltransferase domain-containing protein [Terracidiphilus sp.]|jgi:SAM-dependent methyltransferase
MPHNVSSTALDFRYRAQLTELMDEPCSRETMRACLQDLARVNRWFLAYRPLLGWLDSLHLQADAAPVRLLDVGCGYGDSLRRIERWAYENGVAMELTGLDLNPDATAIAAQESGEDSRIRWVSGDVFSYQAQEPPTLIVSSLFTHHLGDADVVRFLRWMEQNALAGWFVNDLSRARIPYYLFSWFAKVAGLHPFVQHDGPVSIARAFSENDWRRLAAEAGFNEGEISIASHTPARVCVSRRKPV